jgi:hypothetical protein
MFFFEYHSLSRSIFARFLESLRLQTTAEVSALLPPTLQRNNTQNSKQIFPEKGIAWPQSHFQMRDLYISTISLPIAHRHMNVEIGTEARAIPFWEHINGIFVAVHCMERKPATHISEALAERYLNE